MGITVTYDAYGNPVFPDPELQKKEEEEKERKEKEKEQREKKRKKKKELEPLTVESLLNVNIPKAVDNRRRKSEKKIEEEKKEEEVILRPEADTDSQDGMAMLDVSDGTAVPANSQMLLVREDGSAEVITTAAAEPEEQEVETTTEKVYHFAWDEPDVDKMSDADVSSVHTSDLSSFDDDSDSDFEFTAREVELADEEKETRADSTSLDSETVDDSVKETGTTEESEGIKIF